MELPVWRICIAACLLLAVNNEALAQIHIPPGGSISVSSGGSMNLGCTALTVQGIFNVSGQVSSIGDVDIGVGGNINGEQGTLTVSGNWNNSGTFNAGTGNVVFTDGCAVGPLKLSGTAVFNNLTLTSANGRTFVIPAGSNITVLGTLTLQGVSGQPIHLISSSGQTAIINLGPNAQVIRSYVDVNPHVQIGAAPQGIPTLGEYGLILLALLVALTTFWQGQLGALNPKRKNTHH